MIRLSKWITLCFFAVLLPACSTQYPQTCPSSTPIGLMNAAEIARDKSLPFQFPLEESKIDESLYYGWFGVSNECPPDTDDCYHYPEIQYHATEDYHRPAGTPVYAIADGRISYSGKAGGYGWLDPVLPTRLRLATAIFGDHQSGNSPGWILTAQHWVLYPLGIGASRYWSLHNFRGSADCPRNPKETALFCGLPRCFVERGWGHALSWWNFEYT